MQFQTPKAAKPRGYGLCSPASTIQTLSYLYKIKVKPECFKLSFFPHFYMPFHRKAPGNPISLH